MSGFSDMGKADASPPRRKGGRIKSSVLTSQPPQSPALKTNVILRQSRRICGLRSPHPPQMRVLHVRILGHGIGRTRVRPGGRVGGSNLPSSLLQPPPKRGAPYLSGCNPPDVGGSEAPTSPPRCYSEGRGGKFSQRLTEGIQPSGENPGAEGCMIGIAKASFPEREAYQ